MEIPRDNYHDIFGSSDEEMDDKDSDIDISDVEDKSDETDESGSAGKGDEPVEWTDCLSNIHVDDFTLPTQCYCARNKPLCSRKTSRPSV